jgi:hypothetical protein
VTITGSRGWAQSQKIDPAKITRIPTAAVKVTRSAVDIDWRSLISRACPLLHPPRLAAQAQRRD